MVINPMKNKPKKITQTKQIQVVKKNEIDFWTIKQDGTMSGWTRFILQKILSKPYK